MNPVKAAMDLVLTIVGESAEVIVDAAKDQLDKAEDAKVKKKAKRQADRELGTILAEWR